MICSRCLNGTRILEFEKLPDPDSKIWNRNGVGKSDSGNFFSKLRPAKPFHPTRTHFFNKGETMLKKYVDLLERNISRNNQIT